MKQITYIAPKTEIYCVTTEVLLGSPWSGPTWYPTNPG